MAKMCSNNDYVGQARFFASAHPTLTPRFSLLLLSGAQKEKEPFLFPESFPFLRKGKGKLYIFSGLERKGKGKVIFKRN